MMPVECLGFHFHCLIIKFDPPTSGKNLKCVQDYARIPMFENISISHLTAETKFVNKRKSNIF